MQIIESASNIHNLAYRLSSDHCAVVRYMTAGLQIRGALLCWGGHGGDRRLSGCGSSVTVGRFTLAGLVDTFPLTFSLFLCNAFWFQALSSRVGLGVVPVPWRPPFVARLFALDFCDWFACWLAAGVEPLSNKLVISCCKNMICQGFFVTLFGLI